jgi:hypothetical protein
VKMSQTIGALFYLLMAVFCAKILWNLAVPYVLVWRSRNGTAKRSGISLMPMIEVLLLVCAFCLALIAPLPWPATAPRVAILGISLILASYLHLYAIAAVGALVRKRNSDG